MSVPTLISYVVIEQIGNNTTVSFTFSDAEVSVQKIADVPKTDPERDTYLRKYAWAYKYGDSVANNPSNLESISYGGLALEKIMEKKPIKQ